METVNFNVTIDFKTQIKQYSHIDHLFAAFREDEGGRKLWIVDAKVYGIYGQSLHREVLEQREDHAFIVLPHGEGTKTLEEAMGIYGVLSELQWTKKDGLIAFGGGMVGDLTGFVAGTYLRGLPLDFVPTTLLSQVDSSVGGKVAVNTPWAKNQIGLYYPAERVHVAEDFLKSLSVSDLESGIGELLKMLFLFDPTLNETVGALTREDLLGQLSPWVHRALSYKIQLCQTDFLDKGERQLLNFGHSLGHALESHLGYANISHGTAVALGMLLITGFFESTGDTQQGTTFQMRDLYNRLGLTLPSLQPDVLSQLVDKLMYDKKRLGDQLTLVGIKKIGEPFLKIMQMKDLVQLKNYLEGTHDL